jgi:hypothetical protein
MVTTGELDGNFAAVIAVKVAPFEVESEGGHDGFHPILEFIHHILWRFSLELCL